MAEPWSVERVESVAPDAASATAGRKLAKSGPWSDVGAQGDLLWGSFQGSGGSPYRVSIDTAAPAYKCSCPSRKFPCKHSLGLLFLWAQDQICETGEIAEFAQKWQEAREKRAAAKAAPKEQTAQQRAAANARAAKRDDRVSAGFQELERFLVDQVREGLASHPEELPNRLRRMAARMVDAQIPEVSLILRELAYARSTPDWPTGLLDSYASCYLLAKAWAGREKLPEDLVQTVRQRIGFPVPTQDVLARPGVRDRWVVVGMTIADNLRVMVRRVVLWGRETNRRAVVLFYSREGVGFEGLLTPGTEIDADLHFYPGRGNLRAAMGERYREYPKVTDWSFVGSDVATAVSELGEAIVADPWQDVYPVAVRGRLSHNAQGFWLVAETGLWLTTQSQKGSYWDIILAGGNEEITIFGDLNAAGLRVLSYLARGQLVPMVDGFVSPVSGLGQSTVLPAALVGSSDDNLLAEAARDVAVRRASVPTKDVALLGPIPDNSSPEASDKFRSVMSEISGVPGNFDSYLMAEALGWLADTGRVLPDNTAAGMLRFYRRIAYLAEEHQSLTPGYLALSAVLPNVLGERGHWLFKQVGQGFGVGNVEQLDQSVWEEGTTAQRVAWLRRLRAQDPEAGRAAVASTSGERASDRARFLATLEIGLSAEDEELLAAALRGRSKEAAEVAAKLLAKLPSSAWTARLEEIAASSFVPDGSGQEGHGQDQPLNVTSPASALITPERYLAVASNERLVLKDNLEDRLLAVVALVRPQRWLELCGVSAEHLALSGVILYGEPINLVPALAEAAARWGDVELARTLLGELSDPPAALVMTLPDDERNRYLAEQLPGANRKKLADLLNQIPEGELDPTVAQLLLKKLEDWVQSTRNNPIGVQLCNLLSIRSNVRQAKSWIPTFRKFANQSDIMKKRVVSDAAVCLTLRVGAFESAYEKE